MCGQCRAERRIRVCGHCGATFERSHLRVKFCSSSCAARARYSVPAGVDADEMRREWRRRKERARRYNVTARERYTLDEIATRDAYRCGLCDEPVRMDLHYQDPDAATIDHILPISLGGDDTRANVQLAHRACNTKKGARVVFDLLETAG